MKSRDCRITGARRPLIRELPGNIPEWPPIATGGEYRMSAQLERDKRLMGLAMERKEIENYRLKFVIDLSKFFLYFYLNPQSHF